jgi:hypothetical protein
VSLSDDEVNELASNLKLGVPFATPVFDGAHEWKSVACWNWPTCRPVVR